jgi:hypothetical protein
MGANEHGVVIGNEALHARRPASEANALTGMDLVRLALERSATALEAVEVIAALLERHGQGGNCGHRSPSYYNNGFLIADRSEAFVLETLDREWLVERVRGVRSISNIYSIGRDPERMSGGWRKVLEECGGTADPAPEYAELIGNPNREHIGQAGARRGRSTSLLSEQRGRLDVPQMIAILRDHGVSGEPGHWPPNEASKYTICMHAGAADRVGQTTGSLVSELRDGNAVHWVTGTSAPCISIFKPVLMDVPLPPHGRRPSDRFDAGSLWWRHELVHRRALMGDFSAFADAIATERNALEARFRERIGAVVNGGNGTEKALAVLQCWNEALEQEEAWHARTSSTSARQTPYDEAWREMSTAGGVRL